MINICPLALSSKTPDQLLATVTHEMTHALVRENNAHPGPVAG